MSDWYYGVRLAQNEDAQVVENVIVQLICDDHQGLNFYEDSRKAAACNIALDAFKSRYGWEAKSAIGYKEASHYSGNIPMNLGDPLFTADCGCRAW
jgi:hypothetical protein